MKALSIRQPWAYLVLHGSKDIENRTWKTKVRGRVLVHASKGMTHREYDQALEFAIDAGCKKFPLFDELMERGGIVGSVEIADCVTESASPWFMGSVGFILRDPRPMPFIPMSGRLGFFEVPDSLVPEGHK